MLTASDVPTQGLTLAGILLNVTYPGSASQIVPSSWFSESEVLCVAPALDFWDAHDLKMCPDKFLRHARLVMMLLPCRLHTTLT